MQRTSFLRTAALRSAVALSLFTAPLAAQSIVDPGFESNPLGGAGNSYVTVHANFVTGAATGVWGVESGAIVGAENGVQPKDAKMLRMNGGGAFASQGWQAVDLSTHPMASDVLAGTAMLEFGAVLNAPGSVAAASANLVLHFWSDVGGLPQFISSAAGPGLVLDTDPGTWQSLSSSRAIPAGTRWVMTELFFVNTSIAGQAAYADDTWLSVACGSCSSPTPLGVIPAAGTGGGGTFPTALPPSPSVAAIAVTVPAGATRLSSVRLNGFSHTWAGDLQFVLDDPTGARHNLLVRPGYSGSGSGCNTDFTGGAYRIVDVSAGATLPCTTQAVAGTYAQDFGVWPSGASGISNTPMCSIPVASGTWTLTVYDWASADTGAIGSVELCFDGAVETVVVRSGQSGAEPGAAFDFDDTFRVVQTSVGCNQALGTLDTSTSGALAARVVAPHPGWTPRLALDPSARWISNDLNATSGLGLDRSVLYSVDFTVATLGNPQAKLDVEWICDDSLGVAGVTGLYLNGQPLGLEFIGHSGRISYGPLVQLRTGVNTLHVYQRDLGCSVAGLLFSARLQVLPCMSSGPGAPYCTAGTTSNGCQPLMSAAGTPSASLSVGTNLIVRADEVDGQRLGLIFYALAPLTPPLPWGTGTSLLCIKAPVQRMVTQNSGGTIGACDGAYVDNWTQYQLLHPGALGQPWSVGDPVYFQAWFRDPPAPKSTNLSNALEVILIP